MESEIVITGISGRFPESDSVAEFSENLFNKINLVTEDNRRWEPGMLFLNSYQLCLNSFDVNHGFANPFV